MTTTDPLQDAIDWQRRLAQANDSAAGIADVRSINERFMAERSAPLGDDVRVEVGSLDGVPVEWLTVGGREDGPLVFFLHGGGMMLGAAAENRTWTSRIARATGGRVVGVDYRLAPEHPYPASLDDATAAYRALVEGGEDPARIAVLGESAGGGLALATLIALRDEGLPAPAAGVLTSPLVDFGLGATTLDEAAGTDQFVTRGVLTMMMDAVLQGQDARAASPLFRDLAGLPPLLVQVGAEEALFDDSARLVAAAEAAGVRATLEPWDDMIHLWHGFPDLPQAGAATERITSFVLEHAAGGTGSGS